MREILFRAKEKETGVWVEGDLVRDLDCFGENKTCIYQITGKGCWRKYFVDPETVCQYTGHKDDTGKRIFEGDIVGFEDMTSTENGYSEMDCCGKVGYDEEEACFYVTDRLSAESWEVLGECHIIGNIFDNPKLIGEQS